MGPTAADYDARAFPTIWNGPLQMLGGQLHANPLEGTRLNGALGLEHRRSLVAPSVPPSAHNGSRAFRRVAAPDRLHPASPFQSPSDRPTSGPRSANVVRSLVRDEEFWSAPCRSMPVAVRKTTKLSSKPVRRRLRSPGSLEEPGRSACANPHRSDSNRLLWTIAGLPECRSHAACARSRRRNRSSLWILPEPARKVRQGDARIGDVRMPLLFPFERHKAIVFQLAQRGSNLCQREIAIAGKGGLPAILVLAQVLEMHVAHACSQAASAFLWPLARFKETIRRVPNDSDLRPSGFSQNQSSLGCACEITMGFQPNLDSSRSDALGKLANGIGNPTPRRGPIRVRLDRISEHPDAGRVQRSRQVRHALALLEPMRAFMGIGKVESAIGIHT